MLGSVEKVCARMCLEDDQVKRNDSDTVRRTVDEHGCVRSLTIASAFPLQVQSLLQFVNVRPGYQPVPMIVSFFANLTQLRFVEPK